LLRVIVLRLLPLLMDPMNSALTFPLRIHLNGNGNSYAFDFQERRTGIALLLGISKVSSNEQCL
jgi:hypothetical protein